MAKKGKKWKTTLSSKFNPNRLDAEEVEKIPNEIRTQTFLSKGWSEIDLSNKNYMEILTPIKKR